MTIKQTLYKLPEFYFILIALLAGFTPPFSFNPLSLIIAAIVLLQFFFKSKAYGLILGSLLILANLFMLGALISEYQEFAIYTDGASQLLLAGILIWSLNVLFAGVMMHKSLHLKKGYPLALKTEH